MPKKSTGTGTVHKAHVAMAKIPRSYNVALRGVKTTRDVSVMLSDLVFDLIDGRVNPAIARGMVYIGGKMLRVAEVRSKHGRVLADGTKTLNLME